MLDKHKMFDEWVRSHIHRRTLNEVNIEYRGDCSHVYYDKWMNTKHV